MNNPSFSQKTKRIVLAGGGSGGHTFPLIAVFRELKKISQNQGIFLDILYFGPRDFTLPYILKEGMKVRIIKTGKMRRYFDFRNFFDFFRIIAGILQTFWYLFLFMPDVIFSKGGYGSFPVVFWGTIFFIPVIIHESDSVPGLVNMIFGKSATKIFISFEKTKKYFNPTKTFLVGNPIRQELLSVADVVATKKVIGVSENRPLVLVLGGSQGSQHINDVILDCLPQLIDHIEIIHQVGPLNYNQVRKETEIIFQEIIGDESLKKYYHPVSFFEETSFPSFHSLKDVFLISDLIISRAGSGQIFEIAACGKPAILIPMPWASRDHQKHNAYEYAQEGAAIVIEEENLKPNIISNLILDLLFNKEKLTQMSKAASKFAKIEAARIIAGEILKTITL